MCVCVSEYVCVCVVYVLAHEHEMCMCMRVLTGGVECGRSGCPDDLSTKGLQDCYLRGKNATTIEYHYHSITNKSLKKPHTMLAFSLLIFSGIQMTHLYPFTAQARASPMPKRG